MGLLSKKELAKEWNVSITTIDNMMKQGAPYKKIGKLVRFDKEEVMAWADNQNLHCKYARFKALKSELDKREETKAKRKKYEILTGRNKATFGMQIICDSLERIREDKIIINENIVINLYDEIHSINIIQDSRADDKKVLSAITKANANHSDMLKALSEND